MNETDKQGDPGIPAIRELPRSIPPGRDLWPGIEARLGERDAVRAAATAGRGWLRQVAAAAVVAAFAAGILLGRQFGGDAQDPSGPYAANFALLASMEASEREYQAAFRQFIPVGAAQTLLAPQAVERIEGSWRELQQAEAALRAALEEHPENTYLNQKLLDLRAQQLAFMQQLAGLDRFSRRKT